MRTIKIQCWDKKNKKMYPPFELNYYMSCGEYAQDEMQPCSADRVIREWTGLHDKNGKEIYEGDIVKRSDKQLVGRVEWVYNSYKINGDEINDYFLSKPNYYEIIGNIYESPELLKV